MYNKNAQKKHYHFDIFVWRINYNNKTDTTEELKSTTLFSDTTKIEFVNDSQNFLANSLYHPLDRCKTNSGIDRFTPDLILLESVSRDKLLPLIGSFYHQLATIILQLQSIYSVVIISVRAVFLLKIMNNSETILATLINIFQFVCFFKFDRDNI